MQTGTAAGHRSKSGGDESGKLHSRWIPFWALMKNAMDLVKIAFLSNHFHPHPPSLALCMLTSFVCVDLQQKLKAIVTQVPQGQLNP